MVVFVNQPKLKMANRHAGKLAFSLNKYIHLLMHELKFSSDVNPALVVHNVKTEQQHRQTRAIVNKTFFYRNNSH